jgi:hypothetical protein
MGRSINTFGGIWGTNGGEVLNLKWDGGKNVEVFGKSKGNLFSFFEKKHVKDGEEMK